MTLYLKYRPDSFDNIVGQDFIKKTLEVIVKEKKDIRTFIFTGPRGTGKTSTARIFAKAVNKKEYDTKTIDIIEIDGASHTGVDNIREIIEQSKFLPTDSEYKIYIIDEVHMLSKGAFNALLKILEEPPKHVKFILATTEIQKVPETILSRAMRFDFKNIGILDIVNRLKFISKEEGIETDNTALEYIAKYSKGGLRDAIGLLDKLNYSNRVTMLDIEREFGIINRGDIDFLIEKLIKKNQSVIGYFNEMYKEGKNMKSIIMELTYTLQDNIINKLYDNESVVEELPILEELSKLLSELKDSFDEMIRINISIIKIVQR